MRSIRKKVFLCILPLVITVILSVNIVNASLIGYWKFDDGEDVRRQMVVDKFDKKLRNTFNCLRFFIYHSSDNSQSTILCPS